MGVLLPNITSVVAVAIIFGQLFGRDYGLINWVLGLFGVGQIDWQAGDGVVAHRDLGDDHLAVDRLQRADLPGRDAGGAQGPVRRRRRSTARRSFQQLRKITIPAIRPTIIFTVIISTIGGMQILAEPLLFGGGGLTGGSDRQFQTLSLYLYEVGFSRFDFGYASAAAVGDVRASS